MPNCTIILAVTDIMCLPMTNISIGVIEPSDICLLDGGYLMDDCTITCPYGYGITRNGSISTNLEQATCMLGGQWEALLDCYCKFLVL
jgi:hypothetical protein